MVEQEHDDLLDAYRRELTLVSALSTFLDDTEFLEACFVVRGRFQFLHRFVEGL